jgi:hypothetical protein
VTLRGLVRLLVAYAVVLALASLGVERYASLRAQGPSPIVASVWRAGQLVARDVLADAETKSARLEGAMTTPDSMLVHEAVVGTSGLWTWPEPVFGLSLVAGHDGIVGTFGGETAYVTADDLLLVQAYDRGVKVAGLGLAIGVDTEVVWALLGERLHATVPALKQGAVVRRARFVRSTPGHVPLPVTNAETLTASVVRTALGDAARYLARGIQADGRFRYLVDAPTNRTLPGYDWPRHAGATFFLAQAASLLQEPDLAMGCLRAAALMRDTAVTTCGDERCIGAGPRIELGSSALALVAFAEIARSGLDPTYGPLVADLARFLRAQQRADGEFMHEYDPVARRPIDVQYMYYSGEATLALARAHALTHDAADLDAARRGLAHLVGPAWSFFGDRYYFGEEHWTCQALSELWDTAPDARALSFCARWQAYGRKLMYEPGETPFDADGAYGVGPLITPRYTPVGSRCEAGVATLDAMTRANADPAERAALTSQLRRSLALLLRVQFRPGPTHLFADPAAVFGALPGSAVDWQLRIDYAQHAGSAMLRAADFWASAGPGAAPEPAR